ncbi:hypothetical protein [Capnocytophaga sp.]|uniref:hypothetical protein n=1 Tax=Capnocytophaga sp. TaxID=44737 RepID=UPI0026DDB918|nr:hypothetical protein [Capnocytophaga sp.]MDO5106026.1 hypothetical protein [Capnocytophaga sp.]
MAWKETTATAWDGIDFKVGTPGPNNTMATSFTTIGCVLDMQLETEDGEKVDLKDINGSLVGHKQKANINRFIVQVKNLNKSNLEKFWQIEEDTTNGTLKVKSTTTSKNYSIQVLNTVQNAEIISAAYCSVSAKMTFDKDKGYGLEVTFTILDPANGKEIFVVGQTA